MPSARQRPSWPFVALFRGELACASLAAQLTAGRFFFADLAYGDIDDPLGELIRVCRSLHLRPLTACTVACQPTDSPTLAGWSCRANNFMSPLGQRSYKIMVAYLVSMKQESAPRRTIGEGGQFVPGDPWLVATLRSDSHRGTPRQVAREASPGPSLVEYVPKRLGVEGRCRTTSPNSSADAPLSRSSISGDRRPNRRRSCRSRAVPHALLRAPPANSRRGPFV